MANANIARTQWMFANVSNVFLICPLRNCQVEEEPEDSDDEQPTYSKTYKQQ